MKKDNLYSPARHLRPVNDTPLSLWLSAHGVTAFQLAQELRCDPKSVSAWASNRAEIGLGYAFLIEKATHGGVPAVSWLGTELFKYRMRERGADWDALLDQRKAERKRNAKRQAERAKRRAKKTITRR